jgi:N-dimethylarginine dimethylaminohydrolase
MVYTEYDPLEEVIVADSYLPGDLDHLFPNNSLTSFNKILEETKEDFDRLSEFLIRGGVKVTRPQVMKYPDHIAMSGFDVRFPMGPTVPRDQYKVQGKTILQTYTSLTDRYFDSLSYYKIFSDLFDQGYNWISQPSPPLVNVGPEDIWYVSGEIYRTRLRDRLLFHTATMFPVGDKIIINSKGPGNTMGFEWLKRNLPEYKFVENHGTRAENYGHIDHGFIMIDDETVIHAGIDWVPLSLRHLKLIDVKEFVPQPNTAQYKQDYISAGGRYELAWVEQYLDNWRGYNQDVCFDLNVLIVDRNNIIFGRALPELFRYLKTFGIECHVCEQRHMLYWEGGVHCSTLDVKRQGNLRSII